MMAFADEARIFEEIARAAQPGGRTCRRDDEELLPLEVVSKSARPFDVLVEPLTGSQPYPYKEAICASW
jgi:hypothetical protein